MKLFRFMLIFLCFALVFLMPMQAFAAVAAGESAVGTQTLDAAVSYLGNTKSVENATTVFLYETGSDTLMYAQNPDMQIYPSSLVKVLTALIAVENGDLSETVTVTQTALDSVPYDAVSVELKAGEKLSLFDLLYCMMVGSANDAAAVIAEHISGDQAAFVEEMNRYAQTLGCTATKFTNPHGLHDPEQYSTARDLARILTAATDNEDFMTFFSAVNHSVPATDLSPIRKMSSTNFLRNNEDMEIYYDSRVTGGRTGIAEDGTRCLAASAESDGLSLVCILTGAESTFDDRGNTQVYGSFKETSALLDAVFGIYRCVQVLYEGQPLKQYDVVNGTNHVVAGANTEVTAILPSDVASEHLDFRYRETAAEFRAPVAAGQKLAEVEVWYGNMCVAKSDVLAMHDVAEKPLVTETEQNIRGGAGKVVLTVFLVLLGLAAAAVLTLYVIRWVNMFKAKRRTKQYRRNRRRSR
ncbi:MAG: D-alanyl-D-alanine carboxypeptidase [Oscillospiraceae bacterium]|nr:D-alanyl-D-alanine carboxypeptidase [Oscillospiraceae bacterium]